MAWVSGFQKWLSESDSLKNAQQVVNYYYKEGSDWTKESICGMLGNMRHESSLNPNMYEYGYTLAQDRGFGLVQWTPRSKYWNWAVKQGLNPDKAESQLARIDFEVGNNIQYIANGHQLRYGKGTKYNFSFVSFRKNTESLSVSQLTEAFMWNYEGPSYSAGTKSLAERSAFANKCFTQLVWTGDHVPDPDPDPEPEPEPTDPPKENPEYDIVYNLGDLKDFLTTFKDEIVKETTRMLQSDLFNYGTKKEFGNSYLKAQTQLNNMYKLQKTSTFDKNLDDVVELNLDDLVGLLKPEIVVPPTNPLPPDPEPEPDPTPVEKIFFPVDTSKTGVNFWFPPHDISIKENMDYGVRTSGKFHAGYDIGAGGNRQLKVYATTTGKVTLVGDYSDGWGTRMEIQHTKNDTYKSLYAHMVGGSQRFKVGDTVQAGQQIGVVGQTGGNYAVHLHYELSPTGIFRPDPQTNTIDPKPYLKIVSDNKTNLPISKK